jgi:hypothetical protein
VAAQYARLLNEVQASRFAPLRQSESTPDAEHAAWIHAGFEPQRREAMLDLLRGAHAELVASVVSLPEDRFSCTVPITFSGAAKPWETSAEEVVGWVRAHDLEHTAQVGVLVRRWIGSRP